MSLIQAKNISKSYRMGEQDVLALKDISFEIGEGAFAAFVGPSGSGKSTLLNLIGCLDHPSSGTMLVHGTDISTLTRSAAATFRGEHLGFVFQDFNLVPVLSAYENIEYPLLMVRGWSEAKRRERVNKMIAAVGMTDQAHKRPDQLSGGQKQRVAVARALINHPALILADEPTGNLDEANEELVVNLFRELHGEGHTILLVTHDSGIAGLADRRIELAHGRLAQLSVLST